MDESIVEVELTEEDILGAKLDEPLEKHAIPELKGWLLCCGIRVPPSFEETTTHRQVVLNVSYSYHHANHNI